MPDLNEGNEPGEAKWGLSYAFYLTLTSSPVIFVGGLFFGSMEAFALDKDEDWEDDEYDEADDDYSEFSSPCQIKTAPATARASSSDGKEHGVTMDMNGLNTQRAVKSGLERPRDWPMG